MCVCVQAGHSFLPCVSLTQTQLQRYQQGLNVSGEQTVLLSRTVYYFVCVCVCVCVCVVDARAKPISMSEPASPNLVTLNWCNRNAIQTPPLTPLSTPPSLPQPSSSSLAHLLLLPAPPLRLLFLPPWPPPSPLPRFQSPPCEILSFPQSKSLSLGAF